MALVALFGVNLETGRALPCDPGSSAVFFMNAVCVCLALLVSLCRTANGSGTRGAASTGNAGLHERSERGVQGAATRHSKGAGAAEVLQQRRRRRRFARGDRMSWFSFFRIIRAGTRRGDFLRPEAWASHPLPRTETSRLVAVVKIERRAHTSLSPGEGESVRPPQAPMRFTR